MSHTWRSFSIDLTEGCNLACDYCFTESEHKVKRLERKLGERIVDWFLPQCAGDVDMSFWGGEPLLEFELLKHLRHYSFRKAKEIPAITSMRWGGTTNGLLYTPDKVEWLAQNNCLMMVSIDGIRKVHDSHRRTPKNKPSWRIVDKNIREALKINKQQNVRMSLSLEAVPYFYESMLYFFEDLGVSSVAYSPVFEQKWKQEHFEKLAEQFDLITDFCVKRLVSGQKTYIKHLWEAAKARPENIQNPCGAGIHYCGWSVDGFLYPCHRFNKHGQTWDERYNSSVILARPKGNEWEYVNQEFWNLFPTFKDNPNNDCRQCEIFKWGTCHGGCYAANYDLTGHVYGHKPHFCQFNKLQEQAGRDLKKKCDEAQIPLDTYEGPVKSCVCYNMCYSENEPNEIITIDRRHNGSCVCFQTAYQAEPVGLIRPIGEKLEEQRLAQKMVELVRQRKETERHMSRWDWFKYLMKRIWYGHNWERHQYKGPASTACSGTCGRESDQ